MDGLNFQHELDQYRRAARDAYQNIAQLTGVPLLDRSTHLKALRNMSEADFSALADEYGTDQVLHYLNTLRGG